MDNSNNVVFETDDPNFEWDGTINGRVIPGSYIGLLSAIGEDGKDHLKQVLITVQ